jgi:pyrrolidone-carboxylate peptidase
MNLILAAFLFSGTIWARPTVLVSYYDPFGEDAIVNNSETVAKLLWARMHPETSPVDVLLCPLETKFDESFRELDICVRNMRVPPVMVIGLGETGCGVKIETMGRNLDRTIGPDNAGVERNNQVIIPEAPKAIGFTYPLPEMYCALSDADRAKITVSNNAGSFVCNNTAFQLSWHYPELKNGFMHVANHGCKNIDAKNIEAVNQLAAMITAGARSTTPVVRLPVSKQEMNTLRLEFQRKDKCLYEFYKRARAYDEKSFWDRFNSFSAR